MSKTKKYVKSKNGSTVDFMKAVKRADREMELENSNGFVSTHKTHKSKKAYNRKSKFSYNLLD
jgi:hypothetical protein